MEISMGPFFDAKRQCRIKYPMGTKKTFANKWVENKNRHFNVSDGACKSFFHRIPGISGGAW